MTSSPPLADAAILPEEGRPCACGSGLAAARCCAQAAANLSDRRESDTAQVAELARDVVTALDSADLDRAEGLSLGLLSQAPRHAIGLSALYRVRQRTGPRTAALALLRRLAEVDPNALWVRIDLAVQLLADRSLLEAERHARDAVRLDPGNAQAHHVLAMVLTEAHRPWIGEVHYRRAIDLSGTQPDPVLLANFGWNLKMQGRIAEARALYERSTALDPMIFKTWLGWARMEEAAHDLPRAEALLDDAERLVPDDRDLRVTRATVLARKGALLPALALIEAGPSRGHGEVSADEELERGRILDRLGRFDEAFAAFANGKARLRASGRRYDRESAEDLAERLKRFFVAPRLRILPRAGTLAGPQPLFIVGAPRSGTTLVEQMLAMHPTLEAGDELPAIADLIAATPRLLNSPLFYPEALAELWMGDQADGLDRLRDDYLRTARLNGVSGRGKSFFTDKMPFNEMHLGLIALLFPKSPILHVLRHPLDVVLSIFSQNLTHGFDCAVDLIGTAEQYMRTFSLVEHYRREMTLRYLSLRYEDLIQEPETQMRRVLGFLGLGFDRRCLRFHESSRVARTASYAQVREPLHQRSRHRFVAYRRHLEPVVDILRPAIVSLGYEV